MRRETVHVFLSVACFLPSFDLYRQRARQTRACTHRLTQLYPDNETSSIGSPFIKISEAVASFFYIQGHSYLTEARVPLDLAVLCN